MQVIKGMFKERLTRVLHFRIQGKITRKTTEKLREQLDKTKSYNPSLVALSIDSFGGSINQAEIIGQLLKSTAHKSAAPIYTFAEDHVGDSALYLLSLGNKVFADKMSLLGNVGMYKSHVHLKEWANNTGLAMQFLTAGDKKIRMSPFEDLKKEDVEWLKRMMEKINASVITKVKDNRKMVFLDKKIDEKDLQLLFSGKSFSAGKALDLGLIDHIGNFSSVAHKDFYGVQIVDPATKVSIFGTEGPQLESLQDAADLSVHHSLTNMFTSKKIDL